MAPAPTPATSGGGPANPPGPILATPLRPSITLGFAEPEFDGLLVSWNPLAVAEERANARGALGLRLRESIHSRSMRAHGAGPLEVLDLPEDVSPEQALEELSKRPGVRFVEKNWRLQIQATSNDPSVTNGSTWGLYGESSSPANAFGSQAAEAWARGFTGSANVFVGVIDEGSQYNHSDLIGNAGVNPGEIGGNGIDDDGNGYVDDLYGWDFFNNDNSTYDGAGDDHGTHVAGTIGAQGGNGLGLAGVNWDVSLLTAKFLGGTGGTTANAIRAVDYFTDLKTRHGLNLVATNNSWGGGGYSQGLYDAINRANNAGILFVAAAGNSSTSTLSYPAAYDLPNVISVASIDSNGGLSSFSNFGSTWVDLGAPGGAITSTLPGNTYGTYSGTSMATPHVTGALALMRAAQPTATMAQLKQALLESVAQTASLVGKTATGGRLDVNAAIDRLGQLVTPNPGTPTYAVAAPATVNEGTTLTFTITTTNLAAGTPLYWRLSGTGISTADFAGLSSLQGSVALNSTGGAVVQSTVAADGLTEGNESLLYDLYRDAGLTTRVAGATVVLNDTSTAAGVTRWGTTGNDSITGTSGPDRLAGVSATGTTGTAMGAKQVDTLTGQGGADVFLLGDPRGVFYDDRANNTLGSADYALITDFTPGVDKLQVRAGTAYLYTTAASGLSLYWDRNKDGLLTASGRNQDELIAVLRGVTALSGTDLIGV
ncbi:MAG: S8 family peptidase [Cyanobacteriota bacterium]|nr:S8 family peptidase [Cyanobacteriota bacterium]